MPLDTHHYSVTRLLDVNFNRLKEGIRVIEDIFRFIYNDENIVYRLKVIRHKVKFNYINEIICSRDIINDMAKESIDSEMQRDNIEAVLHANFYRVCESARVLEECLKIESYKKYAQSDDFKQIRYEIYDIHATVCKNAYKSIK